MNSTIRLKAAAMVLVYDGATGATVARAAGIDTEAAEGALAELFAGGWVSRFESPGRETVWYWAADEGYDALWGLLRSDPCPIRFIGLGRAQAA